MAYPDRDIDTVILYFDFEMVPGGAEPSGLLLYVMKQAVEYMIVLLWILLVQKNAFTHSDPSIERGRIRIVRVVWVVCYPQPVSTDDRYWYLFAYYRRARNIFITSLLPHAAVS
ncbi:hypothetical protein M426DRAFT_20073 [Hypoxylon sp. CI-4A]|nr:hypothetical protein M426DRAFT_20073 [Hypoxylon sp. CI-4A]